jgi:hypothetical protein
MLRYIPYVPSFLRAFFHVLVLDLVKDFFWSYWDDQAVFVFASINVLYYIYIFAYVEPPLHPWDEADLVVVIFLMCCWIQFAIILLRIFPQ